MPHAKIEPTLSRGRFDIKFRARALYAAVVSEYSGKVYDFPSLCRRALKFLTPAICVRLYFFRPKMLYVYFVLLWVRLPFQEVDGSE